MNFDWNVSNCKVVVLFKNFQWWVANLYENKHETIMIAKIFEIYVFQGTWGKVHCFSRKLFFFKKTIMSPRKRSLSCPEKNLTFFSPRNNHVPREKGLSCPNQQLKPFFSLKNNHVLREKGLSYSKEQLKVFFPLRTIMSLGRRSLNCIKEQLKPFSPSRTWLLPKAT